MTDIIPNSFTTYNLDDAATLQGSILQELQLQVMHNHLADYAEQRLALAYDPEHPLIFLQDDASLKGKLELLRYLMDTSAASLELLTTQTTASE